MNSIPSPPDPVLWWQDGTVLDQIQAVSGVLGLILAGVALIYAWRVAVRQFGMMEEQGTIIDKQTTLAEEQRNIAKRQQEIAEVQHKIMQDQLARQANLIIQLTLKSYVDDGYAVDIELANTGNQTAKDLFWHLGFSRHDLRDLKIDWHTSTDHSAQRDGIVYVSGYRPRPLYPDRVTVLCSVRVPDLTHRTFRWQASCESGRFPRDSQYGTVEIDPPHPDDG